MKITLLQQDVVWGNPAANRAEAETMLARCPESDLYVLPEMWSTGFATKPVHMAEQSADSPSLAWMQHEAAKRNAAIAGSIALHENGHYYNRFFFVKPDGTFVTYDKRHLFSYGHEDEHYTCGTERVVAEFRGVRILLQTCYDLRFPVFSRNCAADYHLALYVANWPQSRQHAWQTLLQARAIENQCYVAGVNRVGDDPSCHYAGGSLVVNPYGHIIASDAAEKPCVLSAEIDMEALEAFRQKFPALKDGDTFEIKGL